MAAEKFAVTAAATGALAILSSGLAAHVGSWRFRTLSNYGPLKGTPKQQENFEHYVRAQQNTAEHVPIFLLTLAGLEHEKIWSRDSLAAYAGIFVLLRVAHSIQLSYPEKVPLIVRIIGFGGQVLLTAAGGATLVAKALRAYRNTRRV